MRPPIFRAMFLFFLVLVSCQQSGFKREPGTLNLAFSDEIRTIDPALAYDALSVPVVASMYSTLFQYDYVKRPYSLQPLLAADMPTMSRDQKTLTIRLRKDVVFQNGKPLVAADFIYAFKRLAWPALASEGTWIFDGKVVGYREFIDKITKAKGGFKKQLFETDIPGLQSPDEHTLVIRLTMPLPHFLHVLAMPFSSPMDRTFVEANANDEGQLVDKAMGTGPFQLAQWRRGHRLILKKNPTYFVDSFPMEGKDAGKLLPLLDKVVIDVVKESQPAWLRFSKGEFDLSGIPKDSYDLVFDSQKQLRPEVNQRGWNLHRDPGNSYFFLSFNMRDPIVGRSNPKAKWLRQAISAAINRTELIDLFTNGRGIKMTHIVPPAIDGRPIHSSIRYDFNPSYAEAALSKAGFPKGRGLPVLSLDMRSADSTSRQMGEYLAKSLAAVGIQLKVQFNTFPAFLEKTNRFQFQILFDGWMLDYPDAENAVQLVSGKFMAPGPNKTGFDDTAINAMVEKVSSTAPSALRASMLQTIDQTVQEESIWVFLYHRTSDVLTQPWVRNYQPSEFIMNRYKYLRVEH